MRCAMRDKMMQSAITVSIHSTRIHELHRQHQHQSTEKQAQTDINHDVGRDLYGKARCDASECKSRLLVLTPIAMNRLAACGDPRAERPKDRNMTKDEMIGWFKSAPMGSRHERMLWAARKIARLTGATEGGSYQMLLIALIGAERRLYPEEFNDCA